MNFIGCNGGQLIGESILLHVALRCNKLRSVDASWSNVGDNGVEALVRNVERLVEVRFLPVIMLEALQYRNDRATQYKYS